VSSARHSFRALAQTALCQLAFTAALVQRAWAESGGEHGSDHGGVSFWPLINFVLLLGVLVYFGREPIRTMFRDRRSQIQSDLDAAAEKLREAEARHTQLQRQLQRLDAELEKIRAQARQRAEQERDQILADARTAAERVRRDAEAAIQQEAQRARASLRSEAAELALSLAAERIRSELGASDRERLIDEFISVIESGRAAGASR
jgi:F-type H+-transporting ATPase subunit b